MQTRDLSWSQAGRKFIWHLFLSPLLKVSVVGQLDRNSKHTAPGRVKPLKLYRNAAHDVNRLSMIINDFQAPRILLFPAFLHLLAGHFSAIPQKID
jgi:hypothetical protein